MLPQITGGIENVKFFTLELFNYDRMSVEFLLLHVVELFKETKIYK